MSVSTEAELRAAFATDTQIDVQADIVLTDGSGGGAVERTSAVTDPVTVDGHGHTVLQTCADNVFLQDGSGLFTARNLTVTGAMRRETVAGSSRLGRSRCRARRSPAIAPMPPAGYRLAASDHADDSTVDSNVSSGVGGGISIGPASPVRR